MNRPWTRRFLPMLVMFSLVLLPTLAACGGNASSGGPVTLTFGWWSNGPGKDDNFKAWVHSFEATHPNIKLNPEIIDWGNYWTKVQTTTAGGNAYDIIGICSCQAAPYYDKGVFYDLSKFSDYQSTAQQLTSVSNQITSWNGTPFGVPLGIATFALGYNKDILQKAGVPFPDATTPMKWEDFLNTYAKLSTTDASGKPNQYAVQPNYFLEYEPFVNMAGGSVYDNQINPKKITVNTAAGIAGLTAYKEMFDKKLSPPFDELQNGPWGNGDLASLETGTVAFARVGAWNLQEIKDKGLNIGMAPIPSITKSAMVSGVNSLSIFRGTKHANEAWEFLKWAASKDGDAGFAAVSDPPANTEDLKSLASIVNNDEYTKAFTTSLANQVAAPMTTHNDLATRFTEIITDMLHGTISPADAAKQMETDGNAILSS